MTDLEKLAETLKQNRMDKKHEDWGFPRGWNEALDFVEGQISKLSGDRDGERDSAAGGSGT